MSYQLQIKQYISDFRAKHGLSTREPVDLNALLFKLRILTLFNPLNEAISGIVGKPDEETKFMLINSNHTIGRQNFTIAHEFYHLFYDPTFDDLICEKDLNNSEERNANMFAAHLLMPEEGLLELIPRSELKQNTISISTLLSIEFSYKCSRLALLNRLVDFKLITRDHIERYTRDIESDALRLGFPVELYKPGNKGKIIGDYLILCNNLYDRGIISETSFRKFLLDIGMEDVAMDADS